MQITRGLLALFVLLLGFGIPAQSAPRSHAAPIAPANFGTPPSGQIPILYNDHTVYTKPDLLRRKRVLAAFIKNHQIYVPLRSMFEQMGATVTASADGRTFLAKRPGTTVSVRLGSREVTINGETRSLDVPPMLYQGAVLVPVRVISEALGAYVLWVSSRQLVVIRYLPVVPSPTPMPEPTRTPTIAPTSTPSATPAPTPAPIPTATPAPIKVNLYRGFVAAAKATGRNYNEFSAGRWCANNTYVASAAYMFKNSPLAVKADYRQDAYVTSINQQDAFGAYFTRFGTIDGGVASVPVFLAKQSTLDARLEYKLADPNVYVGLGYLQTSTNYGYAHLRGVGVGLEKLPDLNTRLTAYGSVFYYPNASGDYTVSNVASPNNNSTYKQVYKITKYDIGLAYSLTRSPIYMYAGISGDRYAKRQNAPIDQTHGGPYLGLGLKL